MFEDTEDIIKQISLGEDSVLELKTVEFTGDRITGPHRNSMADELAAKRLCSDNSAVCKVSGSVFKFFDGSELKSFISLNFLRF